MAVAKGEDFCQFDRANDVGYDCLKSCTGLKEDGMPVSCEEQTMCVELSDSDSCDVISPSPNASSNSRLKLSCRMKKESDQHVNTLADVNANAAEWLKVAVQSDSMPDNNSLHRVESYAREPLYGRQPKTKEVDGCATSLCKPADCLCESDEGEDVTDSELVSVHIPSPPPAEDDTEFSSELPAVDDCLQETESSSLLLDCQAAGRQSMMRVINVLKVDRHNLIRTQNTLNFINFTFVTGFVYVVSVYVI